MMKEIEKYLKGLGPNGNIILNKYNELKEKSK